MPEALFMVFYWIPKVQKFNFLLPLVEQRARVHFLFAAPSGPADAVG